MIYWITLKRSSSIDHIWIVCRRTHEPRGDISFCCCQEASLEKSSRILDSPNARSFVASACVYAVYYGEFNVHSHTLKIDKVIGRATQTRLCGFTVAARKPLEFCSDEHVFERFIFFVGYNGRCFVNCFKQWLILDEIFLSVFV